MKLFAILLSPIDLILAETEVRQTDLVMIRRDRLRIITAHSEKKLNIRELVVDHLRETASLAERFASFGGGKDEARAASLLHDLEKYTDLFQKVLMTS